MNVLQISGRRHYANLREGSLANCNDRLIAKCFGAHEDLASPADVAALGRVDVLFVTMSKMPLAGDSRWMDTAFQFKTLFPSKWLIVYQEGEHRWPTYQSWEQQRELYELLRITDLFLAHNRVDAAFFQLFMHDGPGRAVYFPAVQDLSLITKYRNTPKTPGSVLVQHFDNRSNGLAAALIAQRCGAAEIIHFNTSTYYDGRNEEANAMFGLNLTEVPNCGWTDWARQIARAYVYLHPITVCGAGRDTIACGHLGVPVIGNQHLEAQRELFPDLAIDVDNVDAMGGMLRWIMNNPSAYSAIQARGIEQSEQFNVVAGERAAAKLLEELGNVRR